MMLDEDQSKNQCKFDSRIEKKDERKVREFFREKSLDLSLSIVARVFSQKHAIYTPN